MSLMRPDRPVRRRWWTALAARVADGIYPCECAVCGDHLADGRALCQPCDADLPRIVEPFCQNCGEVFEGRIDGNFECQNCSKLKFSFEFARAGTSRDDRTLELVHRLKYGRQIHLAADLGKLAYEAFSDARLAPALTEKWPLIPVPLHWARQRTRQFNQAAEISRILAIHTQLPVLRALRRTRSTATQTTLTRAQRLENLRGAFSTTRAGANFIENVSSAGAILVDDVFTTGSTVHECAKILRQAGFQRVVVVTVMRG